MRDTERERRREMKRATINMSQMAETMQERSKSKMMMMTRTGKKVTKCWHRFFISFHFTFLALPYYVIPFHSILFLYVVIYVSSYDDMDMFVVPLPYLSTSLFVA